MDDQPFSRHLIRSMLVGFGSREVHQSAFELARNMMPSIIITDLVTPIFNGLGFINMVKGPQSPAHNTPVIVLSGYLTKAAALTVRSSGAEALLVKPVSPKALYEHIVGIVLRSAQANPPPAFPQNRKRRSEQQRKKSDAVAYL